MPRAGSSQPVPGRLTFRPGARRCYFRGADAPVESAGFAGSPYRSPPPALSRGAALGRVVPPLPRPAQSGPAKEPAANFRCEVLGGGLLPLSASMNGDALLPSVDSLRCFVAAAELLSFKRAAASVFLTPAAFSQRIKQLEELLECTLFERSPQRVELTPRGQALLPRAREALDGLRACRSVVSGADAPVRLTLGTRFELGLSWIVPAIIELRQTLPHWRVDLVFGSGVEILAKLDAGRLDAVVTSAPTARADWEAEVLHPEHYAFVAAPSTVSSQPLESPEDARHHVLIDIDREIPLGRYLLSVCPGLSFTQVWPVGTGSAVLALVLAGQGVAVLPRYMIASHLRDGTLVELLPDYEPLADSFRMLFRSQSPSAAALRELAERLRARPLR